MVGSAADKLFLISNQWTSKVYTVKFSLNDTLHVPNFYILAKFS